MRVEVVNPINFTSLNRPIKPFYRKVNNEVLYFSEINYNKKPKKDFLNDMFSFFLDNFANQSAHPYWKLCRKGIPSFDANEYDNYIKHLISNFNEIINDHDTTVMLAKDTNSKICAGIVANTLNIPKKNNKRILYLNLLAVNKDYRKNHIAQKLVNELIENSKGRYDKVFLVSYNESVPFYKKLGFKTTKDNELIEHFAKERKDYPEFASFLFKKI